MKQIIDETHDIAYGYFQTFGFTQEQVETLIRQGLEELTRTCKRFIVLQEETNMIENEEAICDILHALKGLFSQMGHENIVAKLHEIDTSHNVSLRLSEINKLLGLQIDANSTLEEICKTACRK